MSQREIILNDWSYKNEKNQHLLFCVAYRVIVHGETRREAVERTATNAGVNMNSLRKMAESLIKVNFVTPEDVWAAAYRKVTAT